MIARKPDDRPRDAHVVHDALEAVLQRVTEDRAPAADPESGPAAPGSLPDLTITMVDAAPESLLPSPRSWLASELAARAPGELAERWHKTLADLEQHVEAAGRARGATEGVRRARDLSETARSLLASLEKAKRSVAAHQAQVDALEARGRTFRATLGHAIDALSRDRSRELAHLEAIAALRGGIHEELQAASPADARQRETLAWESAAVQAEENRARAMAADLHYQIETLERHLDASNADLEAELADATGMLEGGLSAVRRITGELVRTMADAANCL